MVDSKISAGAGIAEIGSRKIVHVDMDEQILNHFLNRLPIITLKEGSRARVYIGRDLLIPSYAEHRVEPAL
nr:hypothetical protein [Edaphobacter lichenicola]